MQRITGRFTKDSNFTTVFTSDTMYQIARNSGEWDFRKIGSFLASGEKFTKELFTEWSNQCASVGTFVLR